jgi:hypothetical protein
VRPARLATSASAVATLTCTALLQENPIPEGTDPLGLDDTLPETPSYTPWVDPIEKSPAFEQLEKMFEQRICFIDGAMGTSIQAYKLEEEDYRGERYKVRGFVFCVIVEKSGVPAKVRAFAHLEGAAHHIRATHRLCTLFWHTLRTACARALIELCQWHCHKEQRQWQHLVDAGREP